MVGKGPSGQRVVVDVLTMTLTGDGALVFVQYRGPSDVTGGVGAAPIYVAPRFETSDERYQWLNHIQAVAKGLLSELRYDWFELR